MRIEIDDATGLTLDEIKSIEWSVSGKGHAETIRFLANFYKTHRALENILQEELREFRKEVKSEVQGAVSDFFVKVARAGRE